MLTAAVTDRYERSQTLNEKQFKDSEPDVRFGLFIQPVYLTIQPAVTIGNGFQNRCERKRSVPFKI